MEANFELFEHFKEQIDIEEKEGEIDPENDMKSYTNLISNEGHLSGAKFIVKKSELQIIKLAPIQGKFENSFSFLRRHIHPCSLKASEVLKDNNCLSFIVKIFKEYLLFYFISGIYSPNIKLHFSIILFTNLGILTIEYLSATDALDIEQSLINYMKDPLNVLKSLSDITYFNNLIETLKLLKEFTDKEEFVYESIEEKPLADFEEEQSSSHPIKISVQQGIKLILEYPSAISEPEKFSGFLSNKKNNEGKGSTYSWGIMALVFLGAIKDVTSLKALDQHKNLDNNYNIIDLADHIENENKLIKKKLQSILKDCLQFIYEDRITLNKLQGELRMINQNNIAEAIIESQEYASSLGESSKLPKAIQIKSEIDKKKIEIEHEIEIEKGTEKPNQSIVTENQKDKSSLPIIQEGKSNNLSNLQKKSEQKINKGIPLRQPNNLINDGENEEMQRKYEILKTELENREKALKEAQDKINEIQRKNESEKKELLSKVQKEFKERNMVIPNELHEIPVAIQSLISQVPKESGAKGTIIPEKRMDTNPNLIAKEKIKSSEKQNEQIIQGSHQAAKIDKKQIMDNEDSKMKISPAKTFEVSKSGKDKLPNLKEKLGENKAVQKENQSYEQRKTSIIKSTKFKESVISYLENNKYWNFYKEELPKAHILSIISLISYSDSLEIIDFGFNEEFDDDCCIKLIESLYNNKTVKGLLLYENSLTSEMKKKIVNLFKSVNNLKFILIDNENLDPNYAKNVSLKLNIDLCNKNCPYLHYYIYDENCPWNFYSWNSIYYFSRK